MIMAPLLPKCESLDKNVQTDSKSPGTPHDQTGALAHGDMVLCRTFIDLHQVPEAADGRQAFIYSDFRIMLLWQ